MFTDAHLWFHSAMTSTRQFIETWRERFNNEAIDDARLNAELLLAHVLSVPRGELAMRLDDDLPRDVESQAEALCSRRLKREPVDYIIGHREFFGREFYVEPGVLIPRPETELIIELVRKQCPGVSGWAADIGCGSGALAVTLALEFPSLKILATDISPTPLKVTRRNAEKHGVASRVFCVRMDGLSATRPVPTFDLIVSNPPYVSPADYPELQPEVRDHEPEEALLGGREGLAVAEHVLSHVAQRLKPGAYVFLEHGMEQGSALVATAANLSLRNPHTVSDYAGLDRILVAHA